MRLITIVSVSLAAVAASASSYDLMFIQAATADSSFIHRIHRMDPVTGISLGSFSGGPQSYGMAANRSRGELYTADINGNLRTWDYSTGSLKSVRYLGWTQVTDITLSPDGNEVISSHSNGDVRAYNLLTSATLGATNVGLNISKISHVSGNVYVGYSQTGHSLRRFVRSGNSFALTNSESVTAAINPTNVTSLAVISASGGYRFAFTGNSLSGNGGINYLSDSTNDFLGFGGFSYSWSGHNSVQGFAPSHAGIYGVGNDASGGLRITEMDGVGYLIRSNVVTGINGGARAVAIVLAPEPGSLAVMAVGALMLLRRKR